MSIKSILFATSEAHPLIKTGGLADVAGSLPMAVKSLRRDIRIIMPAYRTALENAGQVVRVATLHLEGITAPIHILEGRMPGSSVIAWLIDSPQHFDRPGNPYLNNAGVDWPDNAERFTVFARAVTAVALNEAGLSWQPEIVHCNDWQCGLIPALLALTPQRPATVFTIHNLAYQGLFPYATFKNLKLPESLWSMHAMEFHNKFSFIKGGLVYADMLNTVSPTYAREITTPEHGCGLDNLLRHRADQLSGILNGVEYTQWSPAKDEYLEHHYNVYTLRQKVANKLALQSRVGLPVNKDIPLIGMIGRLVAQKGFDLLLDALPMLLDHAIQIVVLGTGEKILEKSLRQAAAKYPLQLSAHIGYSEALAHQIEGSADMFLMPSRFEPCGLNQIYSLRYGTVPIVRRTGGLADTVVDASDDAIRNGTASGYVFDEPLPKALADTVNRALIDFTQYPRIWKKLVFNGMQQDFSWRRSAKQYLALYQQAMEHSYQQTPAIRL
jgi:starch synthase